MILNYTKNLIVRKYFALSQELLHFSLDLQVFVMAVTELSGSRSSEKLKVF